MNKKSNFIAETAKTLASKNVNSACFFWLHQPEVPAKVTQKLHKK